VHPRTLQLREQDPKRLSGAKSLDGSFWRQT
jgi:hypothetical protein